MTTDTITSGSAADLHDDVLGFESELARLGSQQVRVIAEIADAMQAIETGVVRTTAQVETLNEQKRETDQSVMQRELALFL